MKYAEIQNEIISKYCIDICDGTKCANDWRRTHAHVRLRRMQIGTIKQLGKHLYFITRSRSHSK